MRPFDYLRILQRRWWIPVLGLLVGLLLAFVTQPSEQSVLVKTAPGSSTAPSTSSSRTPTDTTASGRTTSASTASRSSRSPGRSRDAALQDLKAQGWPTVVDKELGRAQQRSARRTRRSPKQQRQEGRAPRLGLPKFRNGEGKLTIYGPQGLVTVAPVPDPPTGALAIVATGGRTSAPEAANTFAKELLAYLDSLKQQTTPTSTAKLDSDLQLAKLEAQNLDAQIAANVTANPLVAQALQARPGRRRSATSTN